MSTSQNSIASWTGVWASTLPLVSLAKEEPVASAALAACDYSCQEWSWCKMWHSLWEWQSLVWRDVPAVRLLHDSMALC